MQTWNIPIIYIYIYPQKTFKTNSQDPGIHANVWQT